VSARTTLSKDEIEGIPLLDFKEDIFSADTLLFCNLYSCRTHGCLCMHGMMVGDCPFLTYCVDIA